MAADTAVPVLRNHLLHVEDAHAQDTGRKDLRRSPFADDDGLRTDRRHYHELYVFEEHVPATEEPSLEVLDGSVLPLGGDATDGKGTDCELGGFYEV